MAEIDGLIQLDEFVSAVLIQIVDGVENAQEAVKDKSAEINPRMGMTQHGKTQIVDFDIAVTALQKVEQGAKVGALISVIGAAVQGESETSSSTVSRIKFAIPVNLPGQ